MIVVNFSHPLSDEQLARIEALTHRAVEEVVEVRSQFEPEQPFAPQVVALADAANLAARQWQSEPILIVPPTLNFIAAGLLAELHGRAGYFLPVVRTRRTDDSLPPRYEVAEILDLQGIRDRARKRR